MKKLISILAILILILTLSACDRNNPPYDDQSEQQDSNHDNQQTNQDNQTNQHLEKLIITHNTQNKETYTQYKLGNYYGSGLEDSFDVGVAEYIIIKDYDEAKRVTDYGASLDKTIFSGNYILALRCLYNHDLAGLIGFKELTIENGQPKITVVQNGSENIYANDIYYLAVPKTELKDWSKSGRLKINKEQTPYRRTTQIAVDNSFRQQDASIDIMSREEVIEFIEKNNLPIKVEALEISPSYLICFSKNNFDSVLSFTHPIIENDTITISRDYNLSNEKEERAFLNIIPLGVKDAAYIKRININSYILKENGTLVWNDYKIDKTALMYDYASFYKTFNGGVYYGDELADKSTSSYTIIETYRELLEKAEFYIDEEIFKNNYVLVLKIVNGSKNHIGYTNAQVTSYGIRLEEYVSTPYLDKIETEREDGIVDLLKPISIEYKYIVIPKIRLYGINKKTGTLSFDVNETFLENNEASVGKKYFDATNYDIKPGDTWRITNKLEMEDFNKKFGTNYSDKYFLSPYNEEYIIIYLESGNKYITHKTVINESENIIKICYLVGEKEETKEEDGYFLCLSRNADDKEFSVIIEYTIIEYGSYKSYAIDKNINSYDFYKMQLYSYDKPEWKHMLIDSYAQLEEIFNTYKNNKYTSDNFDEVFDSTIFDKNYVLALQIDEGDSGQIKNTFYNARIGGDKVLHLYSFKNSNGGSEAIYQMLYFIIIPKEEITCEIADVCVQLTNEVAYNGPFESVSIGSENEENITLNNSHIIINSYTELEAILENYNTYKKLQNIDFENYFVLAFNRWPYYTAEYKYGDFVNFKTTMNGTATITFMSMDKDWISDSWTKTYVLDLVIIPREYLKYDIEYFYVRYAAYSQPFEPDGLDRIE